MIRTGAFPAIFLASATLAFVGSTRPVAAKTLVFCAEGSPENFGPSINTTGTTFQALRPIYNGLTQFKQGTTQVEPSLAQSWDVSQDGLTVTFHLRHNVKWHTTSFFKPTRDFDADDVLFSFNRQGKASNPYYKVNGGGYSYWSDMGFDKLIKSIDKVDANTVKFTLNAPNAPFLASLAMDFADIQSAEYADDLLKAGKPEQIDLQPVGTGPFVFVNYQPDSTVRYKRNDQYWGPKAKLDALVFSINKDPAVRLAKLRANECQVMNYASPADLPSIRIDPKLTLEQQPGLNIGYLAFNNQKPPFTDKRVRLALNMAIDRDAIIRAVYGGAGEPAKNLIPPIMWSWNKDVPQYPHDPVAAKKMLADAGFPNGFDTELWAMPVQRPYNPDARRIAELMQADLMKVGVRAKIVSYEWGEYRKRVAAGEAPMAEYGWTGDNGDPDNFFAPLASCAAARPGGGSASKWCDKDFDALLSKAVTLPDQAARAKLYEQAQVIMHDQAPFFLIAHSITFQPMRKTVTGFVMSPVGDQDWDGVDLN